MALRNLNLPLLLLAIFLALGASRCAVIPIDTSASAALSGDDTIILQGAGAVSQKGYLFFQKREGTLPSEELSLIVPKLSCKRAACARFQFFRKDGSPGLGGGIVKGETAARLLMSDLVGHAAAVGPSDNGEYAGIIQLFYLGNDGQEYSTIMNGFVRLNVLAKDYDPVGCQDPAIAWSTPVVDHCEAQFTTAGRAVACGVGCK